VTDQELIDNSIEEIKAAAKILQAGYGLPWPDRPRLIGNGLEVITILNSSIASLQKQIDKLEKQVDKLQKQVDKHEKRIDKLEGK
jgi:phage shock protein A